MSYEHLRTDFIVKLADNGIDNAEAIVKVLDDVCVNYDIKEAVKDLVPYARVQNEDLVKAYLVSKTVEKMSDKTLKVYSYALNNLVKELNKPLAEVTTNDMRAYLYFYQNKRKVTDRTLNKLREMLKSFFVWLSLEEYIPKNPMERIRAIKYDEMQRHPITQLELERLRMVCRDEREKCMLEFLYSTAARVSEMCNVKLTDINFAEQEVTLFGKGRKERKSYLNAKAMIAIENYLKVRKHTSEYLFCNDRGGNQMKRSNIEKIFRRLANECGLGRKLTPHIMRHTTASTAIGNGMPVQDVQKLLGHSNISTTMIYAETTEDEVKDKHKRSVI